MYHQHQNKWCPQRCLLAHFEATVITILAVANLLAHDNITIHKLLGASKFETDTIVCSLEMSK